MSKKYSTSIGPIFPQVNQEKIQVPTSRILPVASTSNVASMDIGESGENSVKRTENSSGVGSY